MNHCVGIGGYAVSGDKEDVIKTFALSTCVGLIYYSMRRRVLGMAHIQLPNAKSADDDNPSRYADLAPGFLLREMRTKFGLTKGELLVSLFGGIDPREADCFRIGEKNLIVVKQTLRSLGLIYSDADTGGSDSRTLIAHVSSGIVEVIKRPMRTKPLQTLIK